MSSHRPRRFTAIVAVGLFGLLGFAAAMSAPTSRSGATALDNIVINGGKKGESVTIDSTINGKYIAFEHTCSGKHGKTLEDDTKWKSTKGQTCESIFTSGNKKNCKQANKAGVTGKDACQCSC